MTIRARLLVVVIGLVSLGFLGLSWWVGRDISPRLSEAIEESLVDQSAVFAAWLEADLSGNELRTKNLARVLKSASERKLSARIYDFEKDALALRVYVTDATGIVVFDSDGGKDEGKDFSHWNDILRTLRGEYGARASRADPQDPTSEVLYVASPVRRNGILAGVVSVGKSAQAVDHFRQSARRKVTLGALVAGMGVLVLAFLLLRWIGKPVEALVTYTQAAQTDPSIRLPPLPSGELRRLAEAFETLKRALEGRKYVEQYVQSLTHELKSPLTAILSSAELLNEDMGSEDRAKFLAHIREESERLRRMADRVLELSRLENVESLRREDLIELEPFLEERLEDLQPSIKSKDLKLSVSLTPGLRVRGDAFLLGEAFANLLQNAIEFSPRAGKLSMTLKVQGNIAILALEDEGPGIPDYALPRVFDRFYSLERPEGGRKSSGLGLTLVREIAELHGGKAALSNRESRGCRAELRLPLASFT